MSESPYVFILVNPTSGGNQAAAFTKIGVKHISFTDESLKAEVYIYDIREGAHGAKPSFNHMKEVLESTSDVVRMVVAGGDGTVMWAMSEVDAHGIDPARVATGVCPFGTGNDFARVLGWGGGAPSSIIGNNLKGLRRLLGFWLDADVKDFDLWKVNVEVDADKGGQILQVKGGKKVPLKDDSGALITCLNKPLCNYMSIGIESRIGLGFDKNRTTSQIGNKMVYATEGAKKFFLSTPKVTDVVDTLKSDGDVVFSTSGQGPSVKGRPVSMAFLNIPSMAGGCDLWRGASKLSTGNSDLKGKPQEFGDGKIEMVTFGSLVGLSLEQLKLPVLSGNGYRGYQGSGPIDISFRDRPAEARTYMQVDGEYYVLLAPKALSLKHLRTVRVLAKRK